MYTVQETRGGFVVTETTDNDPREAIVTAKHWGKHPVNDGDATRVLCDGELVWPNPLRCDKCGSYLANEDAPCPNG